MTQSNPFWWRDYGDKALSCGVFQGGGAKGAAYGGALGAMVDEEQWFSMVAGSSAGAITAALVAAGYNADELADISDALLGKVQPATFLDRAVNATATTRFLTRYDAGDLEACLEHYLQVGAARATAGQLKVR